MVENPAPTAPRSRHPSGRIRVGPTLNLLDRPWLLSVRSETMRPCISAFLCVASAVSAGVGAQQPNTANASLTVNGGAGPTYPITGIAVSAGAPVPVTISGPTNAPFILFGALALLPTGTPVLTGQLLDVDLSAGGFVVFDGVSQPAVFSTGLLGVFSTAPLLPPGAPVGATAAFQCLVGNPTGPPGSESLTAATQIVVAAGASVIPLSAPNNGGALVDLSAFGLSFSFYGTAWTQMFVNTDGNITFGSASGDFTPTIAEFASQQPRIAPMWTDLDAGFPGASMSAVVDPSGTFTIVSVLWTQMAEWNNVGSRHTFSVSLTIGTDDISITHDPFNNGAVYPVIMGIGPGQNVFTPGALAIAPQKNLSLLPTAPTAGAPNEAFYELFVPAPGVIPVFPIPVGPPNPWDMAGTTTTFIALGSSYLGT